MQKNKEYPWKYSSVGGAVRVKIESGADIAHLGELDQKKWTVLSCPVQGLEFDARTLELLDTDHDGKIRAEEVAGAASWLTRIVRNPDLILKGEDKLALADFNTDDEEGRKLQDSARQILSNLGLEKDEIALEDTADNVKIFAGTRFNGDGVITPASAEDEALKALIETAVKTVGGTPDRSGVDGVNAEQIEAFYAACADYAEWQKAAGKEVLPYAEGTEAAWAAVQAVQEKVVDYFVRCKLIAFDEGAAGAVDVSVDKIAAIADRDLGTAGEEIAAYPLARPSKEALLPIREGINPAWQAAFATLRALVLDAEFPKKAAISEAEWNAVVAKFDAYVAWKAAKKGAEAEPLGLDAVQAILKEDRKAELLALVDQDKALESEALSIEAVGKLLSLYKNFYKFLCNYIVFSDFYDKGTELAAVFQAGQLYIDQRRCDLCIRVADMGKHGDMAGLSNMFILYCHCVSKTKGAEMDIAAVVTDGDVDGFRVGKNGIFYSRDGADWDATVTRIVDNPISIRQAFWAPYRKLGRFISEKVDKSAAEKNSKATGDLISKADNANLPKDGAAPAKPSSFDIAKFAGIFAAIGMAVAYLTQGLVAIFKGAASAGPLKVLLIILIIMLVISLPSMFIAWRKLRRRDLGPVLNANGWAINAASYVNIKFGATLTSLAKYPKLTAVDPKARRRARCRRFCWGLVIAAIAAAAFLFFTDRLKCIGLPFHKEKPVVEQVEAAPAEAAAEVAAEVAAEAPSEAAPAAE